MAELKGKFNLIACWPAFFIALPVLWLFSQSDEGAALYGKLMPPVSPITVTSVQPANVNGTMGSRISGYASINRETCDYINVEWTLHGETRDVRATAFFTDEAEVRPEGKTNWEALLVGVPPEKLNETSGNVRHQCGLFPVLSPFFRPDKSILPVEAGARALCHSGAYTTSTGPGTCSGHGGIKEWLE